MLLLLVTAISLSLASSSSSSSRESFGQWKRDFGKHYRSSEDEATAFRKWQENVELIERINDGNLTWKAKMNSFGDLTAEAFANLVLMRKQSVPSELHSSNLLKLDKKIAAADDSFDWRNANKTVVTSVKDQGSVGSCWAFSTIGNIEGTWALAMDVNAIDLSPEFLVDCDGTHDSQHADCSVFGGWPYLAFQFIMNQNGVPSEASYPYCAGTGQCYPCMQGPISLCGPPPYYCDKTIEQGCPNAVKAAKISGWGTVSTDEEVMVTALEVHGPLSVLLDASGLQFYSSGVWDGHQPSVPPAMGCSKTSLDHAVLLVGYGTDSGKAYWSVKNSWGTKWGEDGYFRITRGTGACGINTAVTTSVI